MRSPHPKLRLLVLSAPLFLQPPAARGQGYLVWQAGGTGDGNLFGRPVAAMGDLDGDGLLDFAVSRSEGSTGPAVRTFSGATGLSLFALGGFAVSGVADAGDLDGDGIPDLVVSSGPWPILARAFSGGDGSALSTFSAPTGPASQVSTSRSCAGAGDVDLDGTPDVLVGCPFGLFAPDTARVFSGATGAVLLTWSRPDVEQFGWSVAGIGDVDADLQADVAVGAPWAAPLAPGLGGGRVEVFSGATGGVLYTLTGVAPGETFGFSLAEMEDVDGDAVPDFLVGSPPGGGGAIPSNGRGMVFSGVGGALLLAVQGTAVGEGFGAVVAPAGDLDGDGVADFGIGAPSLAGGVAVGAVRVHSGSTGGLLFTLAGAFPGGGFGASFAGGGDATGDGIPDLLVGAPYADAAGWIDVGVASLHSFVGIPAGSSLFGSGCPGTGGAVPALTTAGGEPSVSSGNAGFQVVLSRALAGTTASLAAGSSSTTWGGIPLPFDLGPLGVPGCSLLVSANSLLPATTGGSGPLGGTAFLAVPIPVAPSLAGLTVYLQAYVVDPGPAPVPGAMSRGLALLLL